MDEEWEGIWEFPNYQISSFGRVLNNETERIIKESHIRDGTIKVGLRREGVQYSRSVKVLVANGFVPRREENFNTPIHLDNDPTNNRADNIVWRPRDFAWKYTHQFSQYITGQDGGPIVDLDTRLIYENMVDVAMQNGLLIRQVWRSCFMQVPVFPDWQKFEFV